MNVTIEDLAPCKKLVRFEVDTSAVDAAFETVTKDFQREAALPGFRPGKAPRDMVIKRYEQDITDQVKRKLISETYQKGVKDKKLEVIGYPDIEEIQFAKGQALQFAATIETAPKFEMPDYRGLPAKRELASVSEQDIDKAMDALRGQHAKFETVNRTVKENDFVVLNYQGTCEGKPITDWNPVARGLTEKKNFWIQVTPESFIAGFAPQLIGAKAGDKRTVTVDFPADFVTREVAGKKGVYEVEVVEVKERILPPADDAFAKTYGAEDLTKLRDGIRKDLQNELNLKQKRAVRAQFVEALLHKINFDLPESMVQHETRNVVYNIVSENQRRGIPKEVIDQQKDSIYAAANQTAKERVKAEFIFSKIAEKEGIRVNEQELNLRIVALAQTYNMAPEKFLKELRNREGGVEEVYAQLLHEKVVDFLHEHAKIEDVPAQIS
ncbi:MAG TPA: trigger factor [Verrucomicrobiae bacterium]|nr:trigger factor [Verrucomicrobiae bacterium]